MTDFEAVKRDFAETMLMNTDVLEIDLSQNMLRVLVKDDANVENLPATYLHDSDYHIGIEYMTPSRVKAMEDHKVIEEAALAADTTPGKPTFMKVQEYIDAQKAAEVPQE